MFVRKYGSCGFPGGTKLGLRVVKACQIGLGGEGRGFPGVGLRLELARPSETELLT